jgi:hypothetical protein
MYTILGVLAILLLAGIVYAAVTGTLHFGGTSRFNRNLNLNIIDEAITGKRSEEHAQVSLNGDTLTFSLLLDKPGDTRQVHFRVRNVGNTDALLGALTTAGPIGVTAPAAPSHGHHPGITVTWPGELEGKILRKGETSGEYTVSVHWDSAHYTSAHDVEFSASINYQEAPLV